MSHEAAAAVTALIELGMIAQDDIVKCLKKGLSEPEQQRTWVGLTSADWNDFNAVKRNDPQYVAAWAEAKLKEKNT